MDEPAKKRLKLCDNAQNAAESHAEAITSRHCGLRQCTSSTATNSQPLQNSKTMSHGSNVSHKIQTMQRILVSVLHAQRCRGSCQDACCPPMKRVLSHLAGCADGKSCSVPHCRSTQQIVEHFTNCQLSNCPVCRSVRHPSSDSKHTTTSTKCSKTEASVPQLDAKETQSPTKLKGPGVQSPCAVVKKSTQKLFTGDELRDRLMPTWTAIYQMYPHSMPFRQPVDPVLEQIPDYPLIVKSPMDLSTICRKLEDGQYEDPWQYVDDMQLIFSNAWLYNRRSSPIYKSCTKLAEKFESIIDEPMKALGCCCGQKPRFRPMPLYCFSSLACCIPVNTAYYGCQDKYFFCEKCFLCSRSDEMEVVDNPTQPPIYIQKDQFTRAVNSNLELEPFVSCVGCSRRQHQICVQHVDQICTSGYICDDCLLLNKQTRAANPYVAEKLVQTKLGAHLENRVNSFLSQRGATDVTITVRVLACTARSTEVKPFMRLRFPDAPACFPYVAKGIFAFQKIDGKDICFFGLHTQEYGSDAPQPNHRRVYLAYLDSINLFRPSHIRTLVYQQLLIAYFEHVRSLGFMYVHIWACPPAEGDDYIFHRHPTEQKIPKPKRLQDWYRRLLDRAVSEGVVADYKDIAADALMAGLATAKDVPYFDGDFWPNTLEEAIAEEEKEKNLEQSIDSGAVQVEASSKPESKAAKAKKTKKSCKGRKPGMRKGMAASLIDKVLTTMDKHKEMFFIVYLHGCGTMPADLPLTQDPDPQFGGELADGRVALLMFCRERRLEFSTLRRATFTSMVICCELHVEQANSVGRLVRCCRRCHVKTMTAYVCTTCENMELCSTCYEKFGHEHAMRQCSVKSRATAKAGDTSGDVIQRCIETVAHSAACTQGTACPRQPECRKMMDVLRHARACTVRTTCTVCQQLMALCVTHARACAIDSSVCHVPFCAELRRHIQRRQTLQRHQQHQMDDRRRALMTGMGNSDLIQINDEVEIQPNGSNTGQRGTGKGGDGAQQSISGNVSTTVSNPAATITTDQEHLTANTVASDHESCTAFPDVDKKSTLATAAPKTPSPSISVICSDSTNKSTSSVVNLHYTSVPKPAATGIVERKFAENLSAGDGPMSEVLHTSETSARHQIVVGCLRVLKKLHPSMSKQNLLQLLCHCSRQQLTALQDKLREAGLWDLTTVVKSSSFTGAVCASVSPFKRIHSASQSPRLSRIHGRHVHQAGYQQLMDIINLPRHSPTSRPSSTVRKTANCVSETTATGVSSPAVGKATPMSVQNVEDRSPQDAALKPTDILVQLVDTL